MKKITLCSNCSNAESCNVNVDPNDNLEEYVKNIKDLKKQLDCMRVIHQKEEDVKRKELLDEILL